MLFVLLLGLAMMCVVNSRPAFFGLFRTHPPMDDRIATISRMSNAPEPERPLVPVGAGNSFLPPAALPAGPKKKHPCRRRARGGVPVTEQAPASVPVVTDALFGAASVEAKQFDADKDRR